ncbi:AAA family ATPase [Mycobacterium sp. 21AC1]|uniref:helix-turn-helix transcriptional regulator n=1 Tax=[Mycobacterium] appelbergii TaxID=2939269 RepID=UPI002938DABA|nr:AAA family ATPase [Mycobacterium sp. 21AC1]MDV3126535.1 AAA family ATPase [Mycobacterium sp. 21AC1]
MVLIDRGAERRLLDAVLRDVGSGHSRVLVLHGDPGIGKSALLEYLAGQASGCRLVRAAGVESEMELAYAALHQLCAPMLDHLEQLPPPQRDALGTAFGLSAGPAPDRFLIGLAVLSLLTNVADEQPLLCLVDDVQWLDRASAQALAFVGRRLVAESVALVVASRVPLPDLATLPGMHIAGLREADARALLDTVLTTPVDEQVRDQFVVETGGNPLALLELPRRLSVHELAGGFGLPGSAPLSAAVEESFRRGVQALPTQTRRLLLLAAAEPLGDPVLLWRAAATLGIGTDDAAPAAAAGLADFGVRVRFRHPLARSAVYRSASLRERQLAHGALAEATDPDRDADRRAWHRAQATEGPDEEVAAELERSAARARARGGFAAAAAFLERATVLTLDSGLRAERALAAASATVQAGAFDAALELLAVAEGGPLDDHQQARADLIRAQIAYVTGRAGDAPALLLKAAQRLETIDATLARATYLEALTAGVIAGRLAVSGILDIACAAQASTRPSTLRLPDLLLDGLAAYAIDGYAAALPIFRRAMSTARVASSDEQLRCLFQMSVAARRLWDDESWEVLTARYLEVARAAGALAELPLALGARAYMHVFAGELTAAESLNEELKTVAGELQMVTEAIGSRLYQYVAYVAHMLAAFRGDQTAVAQLTEATTKGATTRGEGGGLTRVETMNAMLYNGLGRYGDAVTIAQRAAEQTGFGEVSHWAAAELVEAAIRSGATDIAGDALHRLMETTSVCGTDWALGVEARSRALLMEGAEAESMYCEAIERLGRTKVRTHLARAHLVYGEWLGRQSRRIEARDQLRIALDMFETMGMQAFAERARHELRAAGETTRKRTVTGSQLTPQEEQIARLAAEGLTNPDIGARLFVSAKTVQYHLGKVFTKLDISSRSQLPHVLPR